MFLLIFLFLQVIPQLPIPIIEESIAGEIAGPYIFREDHGQTTKVILQNGLTVVAREHHATPLTSVTTHVKVGYFDEADQVSGISHLIEHLFFNGTTQRYMGHAGKDTKGLGGQVNSYTSYDRTVYRAVVPADNTISALDIQADALWNLSFDSEELAREIDVVLQENKSKLDNPSRVASEKLYGTAFVNHRIRRSQIEDTENLRSLNRDDVVSFYRKYYQPSNIIIAIVGRFDREEILEKVIHLYGVAEDTPVERDLGPRELSQDGFRYSWEQGSHEQAHIGIGYHVPGVRSADRYTLEIIRAILALGRASRMNQFLRDEQGIVTSASASLSFFRDMGYFKISLETVESPVDVEIAALVEIEQMKQFGVTSEELNRAKVMLGEEFCRQLETVNGIAEALARHEAFGDWKETNDYLPGIERVALSDVSKVINSYFTNQNLGIFEYLPSSVSRSFSDEDFQSNVLRLVAQSVIERSVEELPVSADLKLLESDLVQDLIHPVVRSSILRGPDVYVFEDHRLPLISFGIFYPGGRLYESVTNAGITELVLRSALRGTRRYNTADISRRIENAGARVQIVNEPDLFGYILNGVSGQMNEALEILIEILQEPVFPEDQVAIERKIQQARIIKARDDNIRHPFQLFMSTVFDGHSYARPAIGFKETVASLTREDLVAWHQLHQRSLVPLIVIAGDTQGTGLVAPIAEALTNEDLFKRDIFNLSMPAIEMQRQENVKTTSRGQTVLVYGFVGPTNSHPDWFGLKVLKNIVSGLGGRFFQMIQNRKDLPYTFHSSDVTLSKSSVVYAYTAFSPESELKVLEFIEKEMEQLIAFGITEGELRKAINYSAGEHEIDLQTRQSRVLTYARSVYVGGGVASVDGFIGEIKKVGLDFAKSVAERYLRPSTAKIAIVRGAN